MNPGSKLKKIKKRRLLVISAGGVQGGVQILYLGIKGDWEILTHAFMPYPPKVAAIIEQCTGDDGHIKASDLGWLDFKLSTLFVEFAKTALMQIPTILRTPHYIVLNKPLIWKGTTGENLQQSQWDISIGDAQFVASSFQVPVLTDFSRHNFIAGGPGVLPTSAGNQLIASKCQGINVFINIGIICRMSIIDSTTSTTILDSDTGPGTCLQNKFMHNLDKIEKFDRDGTFAAQGKVEGDCLNRLASSPWFLKNGPKQASFNQFDELLNDLALNELPLADRLATITALTARTAYDFYRQTSNQEKPPLSIYISGGGSNNLTLMEYLSTYFAPLPVLNIETLGIPHDMRIPLALALTVDTFIAGTTVNWETGNCPKIGPLGRWFIP